MWAISLLTAWFFHTQGVPTESEFVKRWCAASGLPDPMRRREHIAGDPGGVKKAIWPFYMALSLFRGAAILAGVRARAGRFLLVSRMGNLTDVVFCAQRWETRRRRTPRRRGLWWRP
jgi:uncharacterized membrane protein YphA (DoxX/SURF4 family)